MPTAKWAVLPIGIPEASSAMENLRSCAPVQDCPLPLQPFALRDATSPLHSPSSAWLAKKPRSPVAMRVHRYALPIPIEQKVHNLDLAPRGQRSDFGHPRTIDMRDILVPRTLVLAWSSPTNSATVKEVCRTQHSRSRAQAPSCGNDAVLQHSVVCSPGRYDLKANPPCVAQQPHTGGESDSPAAPVCWQEPPRSIQRTQRTRWSDWKVSPSAKRQGRSEGGSERGPVALAHTEGPGHIRVSPSHLAHPATCTTVRSAENRTLAVPARFAGEVFGHVIPE